MNPALPTSGNTAYPTDLPISVCSVGSSFLNAVSAVEVSDARVACSGRPSEPARCTPAGQGAADDRRDEISPSLHRSSPSNVAKPDHPVPHGPPRDGRKVLDFGLTRFGVPVRGGARGCGPYWTKVQLARGRRDRTLLARIDRGWHRHTGGGPSVRRPPGPGERSDGRLFHSSGRVRRSVGFARQGRSACAMSRSREHGRQIQKRQRGMGTATATATAS